MQFIVCAASPGRFRFLYSDLSRLEAAGAAAIGLIGDLMDKGDCPVAAALTDADRAKLLPNQAGHRGDADTGDGSRVLALNRSSRGPRVA